MSILLFSMLHIIGLVVLIENSETLFIIILRYDNCNMGKFQNALFLFAGTPELFDQQKKNEFSHMKH